MRRVWLCGFLFLASAVPAAADITSGVWRRADGAADVRVERCGGALCAVNVWIRNPGDEQVGDKLIMNVKPTKLGVMEGDAFDPKRNMRFSSRITYSEDKMTTSGCMLGGILCRSVNWTKKR